MKGAAERKRDERARTRNNGYVLRQVWVHPKDWDLVKAYVMKKMANRFRVERMDRKP